LPTVFAVGSMTALPYETGGFDAVLCLWSSFHELLEREEQIKALAEMWRVAAEGGFALIEGPRWQGGRERVSLDVVEGFPNPHYRHDAESFSELCEAAAIESFSVYEDDWAGRKRLFLRLDKRQN
jgi:ubiquinone/menaquinone biosynthesis C-methylase UbiE